MTIGLGIAIAGIAITGAILIMGGENFIGGSMLGVAVTLAVMRS